MACKRSGVQVPYPPLNVKSDLSGFCESVDDRNGGQIFPTKSAKFPTKWGR